MRAIIDEAEAAKATDSARFKPRLQGSAPPRQDVVAAGTSAGSAVASPRSDSIGEVRRALKVLDRRLAGVTRNVRERTDHGASIRDLLVSQRITTKSAEALYRNTKLTREVAEIAITEYTEGEFVLEIVPVEGEIEHAESDLMRARDLVALAEREEDKVWTRLNERRRSLALNVAAGKKKALVEYTKPRRLKELECEVAQARAAELATKAIWENEKRQEDGLEKAVAADGRRSAVEDQRTGLLRRAASLEEQIRAAVDRLSKKADSDEALQKEIRESTNQLGAMVDEAEAASAADNFAGLRPRIRDAARRAGFAESK